MLVVPLGRLPAAERNAHGLELVDGIVVERRHGGGEVASLLGRGVCVSDRDQRVAIGAGHRPSATSDPATTSPPLSTARGG